MPFEIKIHPTLLELRVGSLFTASKSSFWEYFIRTKGLVALPFLGSAVSNVEKLVFSPCINAIRHQNTVILDCLVLSCFLHIHESPRSVLSQVKKQK